MDLTALTYINTLIILIALATTGVILSAIRKECNKFLLRVDERSPLLALQTAAVLAVARAILRQLATKRPT